MQTLIARSTTALGVGIVATLFAARAQAACGMSDWSGSNTAASPQVIAKALEAIRRASASKDGLDAARVPNLGIVGLWSVTFTAENNPGGPPDGTIIDSGYATWHVDHTELMNSGKPPITGSFCMGVWANVEPGSYALNHVALGWHADPSDPNLSVFDGPASIHERVTLDDSGNRYTGVFSIDQYDPNGNLVGHVNGRIDATRITVAG